MENQNPIFQKYDFSQQHNNFENKMYKRMYQLDEDDVCLDPDCAIIDNEMTKILINNTTCPICLGIARLNSAILCSTCGTQVCETPCYIHIPDPKQCP